MRYIAVMGSAPAPSNDESLDPPRLTAEMSSRKLQALDFIKRYFARWGHSPTLGELGAAIGVSAKRAHDLVHRLADEQMIEHETGKPRGIRLVDRGEELSEADVLVKLSSMGWTIGAGSRVVLPPRHSADAEVGAALVKGLTEKGLHALPKLDHVPGDQFKRGNDGQHSSEARRSAP